MRPFINVRYKIVRELVPKIVSLGSGVEIYIDNNTIEEVTKEDARELGRLLHDQDIPASIHAPFMDLSPGAFDRRVRELTEEILKTTVEIALSLRAVTVVCHPGYDRWRFGGNSQLWFDRSIQTWKEVLRVAGKDIPVLLENIFEEEPSTLYALFDYFKEENLWFCFDSGHFNLFSKVPLEDWIIPLSKRVREMHLHDNHATADEHLPIGLGTFPFRELKTLLKVISHEIVPVAETHGQDRWMEGIKKLKEFLA